jgi:hypothetical protein
MGGISAGGIQPTDVRRALASDRRGVTLDNTGDILMYEDWSNGLNGWFITLVDVGSAADLSITQRLRGNEFSARLVTGTVPAPDSVIMDANLAFVQFSPFGGEFAFLPDANTGSVSLELFVADGANGYDFWVRANVATGQLQYQDTNAVFQNFSAQPLLNAAAGMFQRLKFVVDPRTGVYDRVIFNSQQIASIAGIAARKTVDTSPPRLTLSILTGPSGAVSSTVYVGPAVATINEVL